MVTKRETRLQNTFPWQELYTILSSSVKQQIYQAKLQSWRGQEYDLTQDIVQETVVRTFFQMQKAESGQVPPVMAPEYFARRVARNHLLDVARKESRLVRPSCDRGLQERLMRKLTEPCEQVLDDMEKESLFGLIAEVIADFPFKQRKALLIDLADRTPVDEPFSPLQLALKKVNIDLDMYRDAVPTGEKEKKCHSTHLSQAYKRVGKTVLARLDECNWCL